MSLQTTANSPSDRPRLARRKDPQKSAITNGSKLLPGTDQRGPWIRRAKDLLREFHSDVPDPSAAERSIIRRCVVLTVELEQLEAKFANAGSADPDSLDLYVRASGSLRRLLLAIGLQRRPREIDGHDEVSQAYEQAMAKLDAEEAAE